MDGAERFFAYARARYQLMLDRGPEWNEAPPPWTKDPILAAYRFCNVFREDDRVTRWFRENIREPLGDDGYRQFLAAVVFRWFNKIETGELLKPLLLGTWDVEEARRLLKDRVASGHTILGAAYMIKSPPGLDKVDGLLQCIDRVEPECGIMSYAIDEETELKAVHEVLCGFPYLGAFMAYQIVCDLRFTPLLDQAPDINTWTCPGPGSARGLSRVQFGELGHYRYTNKAQQGAMLQGMQDLLELSRDSAYWPAEWPSWELSTVQHNLCELDKYERVRLGEGEPKQRYRPAS